MARMNLVTKKFSIFNAGLKKSALTMPFNKRKIISEIRASVTDGNTVRVKVKDSDGISGPEFSAAPGYTKWEGHDLLSPVSAGDCDITAAVENLSAEGQLVELEVDYWVEAI